ncbi:MAG: aspartyl protease family protein [Desulfobacterales bacterium]
MKTAQLIIFFTIGLLLTAAGHSRSDLTDPYQIFQRHYEAIGGVKTLKSIKTAYIEGTTVYDGLKGRFKKWEESPLRYRLEEDFTIIAQLEGDNGHFSWIKDTNGKVMICRDEETLKRRKIKIRLENFEHLQPDSKFFSLSFEGIQMVENDPCYVVKLTNRINHDVLWSFFDTKHFLLRKSILKQPDMEIHTVYSDYHEEHGIKIAYHEESDIFPREKKEITTIEKCLINTDIDDSVFEMPENIARDFRFQNGNSSENIPFEFVENNIFLRVNIKDDERLWLLDSGASMSVIDKNYADSLGAKSSGSIKGFGFGANFDLQFVTLPAFSIQGVEFEEQKIFSFANLAENFHEPVCFGILGYDFLSRFVVKIDYADQKLSIYDPIHFKYSANGTIIDAPLKSRTFTIPMTVDNQYSGRWSIDLGSFNTSFYFPFASSNNLSDRKGIERISRGMGGEYMEKTVQFKNLKIGGFVIKNPLICVPYKEESGASLIGELAGNIGNSTLRHFQIYLDYEKQQVILEQGKDFNKKFPRDNSGMMIGRTEQGQPKIVFIAAGLPGDKAGFLEGDIILSINRKKSEKDLSILQIARLLREDAGTKHDLVIMRDGQIKTIRLTLENLYETVPDLKSTTRCF